MPGDFGGALNVQHAKRRHSVPLRKGLRGYADLAGELPTGASPADRGFERFIFVGHTKSKALLAMRSQSILSLHNQAVLYPIEMSFKDRLKTARKARLPKTTQEDLAERLSVTKQAVSGWERGEAMPEPDKLVTIASYLNTTAGWLLGGEGDAPAPDLLQNNDRIPHEDLQQARGRPDFPIYASAEGGPGQIIRSSDPIDFQPRPTMLEKVVRSYGLIVTGDSMDPEYRSGDTALVNPHLPPISGEVFIFYAEQDGEARATIKQLRKVTVDKWLVSQHNPPDGMSKDFTLSRKEWAIAHRVVGKYSRR